MSLFHSCSDDSVDTEEKETLLTTVVEQENVPVSSLTSDFQFPVVYVEELDQVQEFFKEQHETSFSHLTNKNWMSYTAGKDGILFPIHIDTARSSIKVVDGEAASLMDAQKDEKREAKELIRKKWKEIKRV